MRPAIWLAIFILLGGMGVAAAFGDTCPAFVEFALARTNQVCTSAHRNEACYGHVQLDAHPYPNTANFKFDQIGDVVPVSAIESLRLSAFDPNSNLWGIALMRVQANIPDTIPGQNITFILFGDVVIQNPVSVAPVMFDITPTLPLRIFSYPAVGAPVLGTVDAGRTMTTDGRSADGAWLRIQMPLGVQSTGWIANSGLIFAHDLGTLEILDPEDTTPRYRPMQAFYLTSGSEAPVCNAIPASGILIQSPHNAGKITLSVNNVEVRIGSTVFFQAQPNGDLTVTTLKGSALVTANGSTEEALAGMRVRVPLDGQLRPLGPPSVPEVFMDAEVAALALPIRYLNEAVVNSGWIPVRLPAETQPASRTPEPLLTVAPVTPVPANNSAGDSGGQSLPPVNVLPINTVPPTLTPIIWDVATETPLPTSTGLWLPPTLPPTDAPTPTNTKTPKPKPTWPPKATNTSIPTTVPTQLPTLTPLEISTDTPVPTAAPTTPPPTAIPTQEPSTAQPTDSPTDPPPQSTTEPTPTPKQDD
ncbi:MAG TPA: hypothetical protein VHO69_01510 [Phototrophicaceae bacterium]|nr:hypothetical protein [Phototrophicaceae bacterium]